MAATQPVKKAAKQKKVVAEMVKDYKFRILAFVNEDVFQFLCSECERGGFSLPQRCALELRDDCFMIEFDSIDKTPIVFFVQNDVSYFLCEPILIVDDATTFSPFKIQSIALDDPEKEELRKYLHNRRVALAKGAKLPAVDYRRLLFIATCQSNPDDADGPSIFGCFVGAEDGADDTKLFVSPISDFIEAFQEKMVSEGDTVAFETMMTSIYDIITKNRTEKTLPDTDVCTWRLQQKLPFIYLLLLWDPVNERIRTYIGSAQSNTRFQPGMKSNTSSHIVYAARIYQNTHDSSFYTSPYKLDDFLIAASYQHNLDTKDREGDSSTDYPMYVDRPCGFS
eukprot:c20040_g1_i1.p1 GENE.c20040_g1_i1~~c20040_g1_i1.p1  ORF type:complete len:338 (-),score=47.37 c20040_g1_i1:1107-2120(-)